jgi:predicted ATPase
MQLIRLELRNFKTFRELILENLPPTVVLVSPNGLGKSAILESIVGAHEIACPYHQEAYMHYARWNNQQVPSWPPHLPKPLRLGSSRAEVKICLRPNDDEKAFLTAKSITPDEASVELVIEEDRLITQVIKNKVAEELFKYHNPSHRIGFIDYFPSARQYPPIKVGDFVTEMADDRTKHLFTYPFNQWGSIAQKFSAFKSYIVNVQLDDFSKYQETGRFVDSLAIFRQAFDKFFGPKKFVGYRRSAANVIEVGVQTDVGFHDIDDLSDGEKEIVNLLGHLFRFRELENVVVWDTPESHLNAVLEARLYPALRQVAPQNQYLIATHGVELINTIPPESLFVIRGTSDGSQVTRASGSGRKAKIAVAQELGAQVGLQLVSSIVVFVEGEEANSDKRLLERLLEEEAPFVNFVAAGNCDTILALGSRANRLLEEASTNGDVVALVDRDYRSDDDVLRIEKQYEPRLFMWRLHEIENLFMDPSIVLMALKYLDKCKALASVDQVEDALKTSAKALREWIAADWVAWEIHHSLQPPSRRIAGSDPKKSLLEFGRSLGTKIGQFADASQMDARMEEKIQEIDKMLMSTNWLIRLPGKQVLTRFLAEHASIDLDLYRSTAVTAIIKEKVAVPEIERLTKVLQRRPAL